jgi:hypothetical protein
MRNVVEVLMQVWQINIQGHAGSYRAPESYTLIFLMAAIMSIISVIITLKIRQSLAENQSKGA